MPPARKKQRLSTGEATTTDTTATPKEPTDTPAEKPEQQRRSLFVRSLPASATSESLTALFSDSYPIKHATAVIDSNTKQCRGYGFVTFADAEDAQRARKEFNGHTLEGKRLRVEIAEPRHRDTEKESAAEAAKAPKAKAEREVQQSAPRLIVRNLPWTVKTPEQLSKLFLSYGKIKQAYLPKNAAGRLAGFGFVVLRGHKNAEKALEGVNGKEVDGRMLAVDWAVSKDVYNDLSKKDTADDEQVGQGETAADDNGVQVDSGIEEDEMDEEEDDEEDNDGVDISDDEDDDDDVDIELDGPDTNESKTEDRSSTLFLRNLPFSCTDEDLEDHFSQFGNVRYARVVMDYGTERSRGVGFVCFYSKQDADACLKDAPRRTLPAEAEKEKGKGAAVQAKTSILQNEDADATGQYTMDGRVLQVSRAVDKSEATRLTEEGVAQRHKRNEDKRRLFLLSEGTISTKSALWDQLAPSERTMREASAKQRKTLIENNPSLHLSLTRLSVRNIPRSVGSKELKALAREAVVGFAADVKQGTREKLSKEETVRGGEEMREAEAARKKSGKGLVKQAKVVFEGAGGSKVNEEGGAGRSRGYGFIEYYTHRNALMGLRWLNGHAVGYQVQEGKQTKKNKAEIQDRKKRLIVEFAIENAQVVKRRREKEDKARERSRFVQDGGALGHGKEAADEDEYSVEENARKRKRAGKTEKAPPGKEGKQAGAGKTEISPSGKEGKQAESDEKIRKRNQIIGRKRASRRARKGV